MPTNPLGGYSPRSAYLLDMPRMRQPVVPHGHVQQEVARHHMPLGYKLLSSVTLIALMGARYLTLCATTGHPSRAPPLNPDKDVSTEQGTDANPDPWTLPQGPGQVGKREPGQCRRPAL